MKTNKIIFSLVIFISMALFFGSSEGNKTASVAVISKIVKDVDIQKNNKWGKAKLGQTLDSGDELKTGKKSLVVVRFLDNSLLRVQENSSLKIYAEKMKKDMSKNTHLESGQLGFKVTKQEDEDFKFTTPTMVASIRGTEGVLEVMNDGSSLLAVETGLVEIEASVGNKQTGSISGGNYVLVTETGTIEVKENTPEIKKRLENNKKTNTRSLILKTNKGDVKIDFRDE
ncbi:MAG TPA: FecR family protein [Ignavibacteriaceae bacterium]|jgi:hypothetical protein|nr:FecR family protein [Ignavibacteriaceae bacterium]HPO54775.1 FecR family protein [Ignavibacteriaceae bacterium]